MDKKPRAHDGSRFYVDAEGKITTDLGNAAGIYFWREAAGPTPGRWLWVPAHKETK